MGLIIHVDGGSRGNPGPAGAGVVIESDDGRLIHEGAYFLGRQTSNAAEYHAIIRALTWAQRCAEQSLYIYSDSELLVRQVTGEYRVKSPGLVQLYQQVQILLLKVSRWSLRHIKREENRRADDLANLAMDQQRDVIVFDVDDAGGEAAGRQPAAPATAPPTRDTPTDASDQPATERKVRVVVATAPDAEICPAAGSLGQEFTVKSVLPAELCVYAAHALLPTLLGMLNTHPQEFAAVPTLTVRCTRPGCGAVFQLSPVHSSNGERRHEDR